MKTATEAAPVKVAGMGLSNQYTIAMTADAFTILSSSLYSDKPLAVVRELSCNAADAHAKVGKPLSDIIIGAPTRFKPQFSVRDFGPGLSKSEVLEFYTQYFASDKRNTNAQIGGFGLGAKCPFAITDTFTVVSHQHGTATTYAIYKKDGMPTISVMSEAPTDTSGLEVIVPITDITGFNHKILDYFKWWPVLPKITGLSQLDTIWGNLASSSLKSKDTIGSLPRWAFNSIGSGYAGGLTVFMGLVPYTVDLKDFPYDMRQWLHYANLILVVNVGDLKPAPSREALSLDKPSIDYLTKRVQEVVDHCAAQLRAEVAAAPTLFEARVRHYVLSGGLPNYIRVDSKWQNEVITADTIHQITLMPGATCTRYSTFGYSRDKVSHDSNCTDLFYRIHKSNNFTNSIAVIKAEHIIVWKPADTSWNKAHHRIKNWLRSPQFKQGVRPNAYVVESADYKAFSDWCVANGLWEPMKFDDVPVPTVNTPTGTKPVTSTSTQWYSYSSGNWTPHASWPPAASGVQPNYYFLMVEGQQAIYLNNFIHLMQQGLVEHRSLIGLSAVAYKTKKKIAELQKAGYLEVTKDFEPHVTPDNYAKLLRANYTQHFTGTPAFQLALSFISTLNRQVLADSLGIQYPKAFKLWCDMVAAATTKEAGINQYALGWFANSDLSKYAAVIQAFEEEKKNFQAEVENLLDKCPLLPYISTGNGSLWREPHLTGLRSYLSAAIPNTNS